MSALNGALNAARTAHTRVEQQRDQAVAIAQRALLAGTDPTEALTRIALIDHEETP